MTKYTSFENFKIEFDRILGELMHSEQQIHITDPRSDGAMSGTVSQLRDHASLRKDMEALLGTLPEEAAGMVFLFLQGNRETSVIYSRAYQLLSNGSNEIARLYFYIRGKAQQMQVVFGRKRLDDEINKAYELQALRIAKVAGLNNFKDASDKSGNSGFAQAEGYRDYYLSGAGLQETKTLRAKIQRDNAEQVGSEQKPKVPFNFRQHVENHGRKFMWFLGAAVFVFLVLALVIFPPAGIVIPVLSAWGPIYAAATWISAAAANMVAGVVACAAVGLALAYIERIPGLLLFVFGMLLQLFSIPAALFLAATHWLGAGLLATANFALGAKSRGRETHVISEAELEAKPSKLWLIPRFFSLIAAVVSFIPTLLLLVLGKIFEGVMKIGDRLLSTNYVHKTSAMNLHKGVTTVLGWLFMAANALSFGRLAKLTHKVMQMAVKTTNDIKSAETDKSQQTQAEEFQHDHHDQLQPQHPERPYFKIFQTSAEQKHSYDPDELRLDAAKQAARCAWRTTFFAFVPNPNRERMSREMDEPKNLQKEIVC